MAKIDLRDASAWVTRAVHEHPADLTQALAARYGVTRAAAATAIRKLEEYGWVQRSGGRTRPVFQPTARRWLEQDYVLPGVDESLIWERDFAPYLTLIPNVANIAHYGFTEMVNNANDHSQGSKLHVFVFQDADTLVMAITDNGIGIFKKISDALALPDMRLSLLELSKGKFTTDPQRHSGEGIFFTSRAFDAFQMVANGLHYVHASTRLEHAGHERMEEYQAESNEGTSLHMTLATNNERPLKEIFDHYTTGAPEDLSFNKTVIPVRLARIGNENLLSRSQAKRLIARIDRFRVVELDFSEVPQIGQAFADELFRVYAKQHPDIQLIPINAHPDVQRMIGRVRHTHDHSPD